MAKRLGVNIDHIATLRNARGGLEPSPLDAAYLVARAGGDGITVHLREDRRHIRDDDARLLRRCAPLPLNLEMSTAAEIVDIALSLRPESVTLVPEKRRELTTEGGLDVIAGDSDLRPLMPRLREAGIVVSLFIDPDPAQVRRSRELGADYVELHTGAYANAAAPDRRSELDRLARAAGLAREQGLGLNAGHGLNYTNVVPVAGIPGMDELNIGHSIVARAVMSGLDRAVADMKRLCRAP
jgi:pyridoxine 5-phosphate synthase